MTPVPFRARFKRFLPSWLAEGEGEALWWSMSVMIDAFLQRTYDGLRARFPTYAPTDALRYISRDRKIVRGIGETDAEFAERLIRWLDDHKVRGNPFALMEQLQAYCRTGDPDYMVRVRTVDRRGNWYTIDRDGTRSVTLDSGNWSWDALAASPSWARFWVIIYPYLDEPWSDSPEWGDGRLYGDKVSTIGTTATLAEVAAVRQIVREWKPAGTRCENIIIAFDDTSFDPTAPEPTGDWDKMSDSPISWKKRLATARYWKGTEA